MQAVGFQNSREAGQGPFPPGSWQCGGSISGSVYAIAKNAKIETNTVNTVYAIAENATLAENSNVIFDFDVIAKKLDIQGNVNRMLNAAVDILEVAQTAEYIEKGKVVYTGECTGKTDLLNNVELVKNEKEESTQESEKEILTNKNINAD